MPLLLIPLVVIALFALWLVLLPLSLWARYRSGRARRRAHGWIVRGNSWLLAASLPVFVVSSWVTMRWVPDALRDALIGLLIGALLGIVSLWMTRFERDGNTLWYTPNRWLMLALTIVVAARILAGLWVGWWHLTSHAHSALAAWLDAGAWAGIAGLFLGYGVAYLWGLRVRLPR
jgi:hypothetical protein